MESGLAAYRTRIGLQQKDLAERLGVRSAVLCKWERKRVPASRVLEVERVTGVSRHELRPDVFGSVAEAAE